MGPYPATPVPFLLGNLLLMLINGVAFGLLVGPWYAGVLRMVQRARHGHTPTLDDAFAGFNTFGPVLLVGLVYALAIAAGTLFCLLPAFILGGLFLYAIPLVALRNMEVGQALQASLDLAKQSWLMHALFMLVLSLISSAGLIFCYVGVFLTTPLAIVAGAVAYFHSPLAGAPR